MVEAAGAYYDSVEAFVSEVRCFESDSRYASGEWEQWAGGHGRDGGLQAEEFHATAVLSGVLLMTWTAYP